MTAFSAPLVCDGRASVAPRPPWHYVADQIVIEFEAEPAVLRQFAPRGFNVERGTCSAVFADWQFATDEGQEYADPVRSQYKEFYVLVHGRYTDRDAATCPLIWVTQDIAMIRGFAQGFPKQFGSVYLTRTFRIPSCAAPALAPGARFGASLAARDQRLATARITLESLGSLPVVEKLPLLNVRHVPQLQKPHWEEPLVHDLVRVKGRDASFSDVWTGSAELNFHPAEHQVLHLLQPRSIGAAFVYSLAVTVDDIEPLEDYRRGQQI